jgi:hypothetical protein
MTLLSLPPDVLGSIDTACQDAQGRRFFTEKKLRPLATLHDPDIVRQRFEVLADAFWQRHPGAEKLSAAPAESGMPTGMAATA